MSFTRPHNIKGVFIWKRVNNLNKRSTTQSHKYTRSTQLNSQIQSPQRLLKIKQHLHHKNHNKTTSQINYINDKQWQQLKTITKHSTLASKVQIQRAVCKSLKYPQKNNKNFIKLNRKGCNVNIKNKSKSIYTTHNIKANYTKPNINELQEQFSLQKQQKKLKRLNFNIMKDVNKIKQQVVQIYKRQQQQMNNFINQYEINNNNHQNHQNNQNQHQSPQTCKSFIKSKNKNRSYTINVKNQIQNKNIQKLTDQQIISLKQFIIMNKRKIQCQNDKKRPKSLLNSNVKNNKNINNKGKQYQYDQTTKILKTNTQMQNSIFNKNKFIQQQCNNNNNPSYSPINSIKSNKNQQFQSNNISQQKMLPINKFILSSPKISTKSNLNYEIGQQNRYNSKVFVRTRAGTHNMIKYERQQQQIQRQQEQQRFRQCQQKSISQVNNHKPMMNQTNHKSIMNQTNNNKSNNSQYNSQVNTKSISQANNRSINQSNNRSPISQVNSNTNQNSSNKFAGLLGQLQNYQKMDKKQLISKLISLQYLAKNIFKKNKYLQSQIKQNINSLTQQIQVRQNNQNNVQKQQQIQQNNYQNKQISAKNKQQIQQNQIDTIKQRQLIN